MAIEMSFLGDARSGLPWTTQDVMNRITEFLRTGTGSCPTLS